MEKNCKNTSQERLQSFEETERRLRKTLKRIEPYMPKTKPENKKPEEWRSMGSDSTTKVRLL